MKKTYFTMEGKPYLIRLQTKNISNIAVGAASQISPVIYINNPTPPPLSFVLPMNSDKKIVPVMSTLSMYDTASGTIVVDIASVYHSINGGTNNSFQKSLLKQQGLIERLYYTSPNYYGYNIAYNQLVLSDDDFIGINSSLIVQFHSSLAGAFAHESSEVVTIPASNYNSAITFLYFEMESKG